MRTIVITGGTDGIGRYLAGRYAARGDRVVIIGRDEAKGQAFLRMAGERAAFRQADLGALSQNRAVIDWLLATCPLIDAVILCARSYQPRRTETDDGIEDTFAHFYLSRFLFSHELREPLERAHAPVIVNVAGAGANLSVVRWEDLQLTRDYSGKDAIGQGGKLNDLLGVSFAQHYPHGRTRYVLVHPGMTATSHAGEYDREIPALVEHLRSNGKPIPVAAQPIIQVVDSPPADPLSAFFESRPIPVTGSGFDPAAARRLHQITIGLLSAR